VDQADERRLLGELVAVIARSAIPVRRTPENELARGGGQENILAEEAVCDRRGGDERAQPEPRDRGRELRFGDRAQALGVDACQALTTQPS
jgi:hypothetical protein